MRPCPRPLLLAGLAAACAVAPAAQARPAMLAMTSTNWAGYAVHRDGLQFRRVSGEWTVPAVRCAPGVATYSASWIGLGGYGSRAEGVEQIGTVANCDGSGTPTYSSWWEVLPGAVSELGLPVHPGDRMAASVTVAGHRVSLRLVNRSRGTARHRDLVTGTIDRSSAEWIVEAPALCFGASMQTATCRPALLADFGTTAFRNAHATTARGYRGAIADARWSRVAITLHNDGGAWRDGRPHREPGPGSARPRALTTRASFAVDYDAMRRVSATDAAQSARSTLHGAVVTG
jgi:hypothetical protein